MRIWLDDERQPPSDRWTWIKTGEEALEALKNDRVDEISFDHDLGLGKSGYDVAKWIEEMAANGAIDTVVWKVHSANVVGRKNIEAAMRKADSFWHYAQDNEDEEEDDVPEKGEWR
jgi:hypothetical protein